MKVVFLSKYFYPHIGGVETHCLKIAKELISLGHTVSVLTNQHDPSLPKNQTYRDIQIYRKEFEFFENKIKTWSWISQHKQILQDADVIHIHDIFWWFVPNIYSKLRKKTFITHHGWEGKYPISIQAKFWKKFSTYHTRKSITVGEFINKWYGIKSDLVTYGASDLSSTKANNNKSNQILVLGRLSYDNDIPLLIKALKQLPANKYKIDFLGDGQLSSDCRQVGNVLGFQDQIQDHIESAQVVITSSYLSILDVLKLNRPVISIYSNPIKEDYLRLHPLSKYLNISNTPKQIKDNIEKQNRPKSSPQLNQHDQSWLDSQSWQNLTQAYLDLWRI